MAARPVDLETCPLKSLKFIYRPNQESVTYSVQTVSTTHCSLKTVSLPMALAVRMVGETYSGDTYRAQGRREELPRARSSLQVNLQSHPLDDFFPRSTPHDWLLQSHVPHSYAMIPEQSARSFIRMKETYLVTIWLHWSQLSQ